MKFFFSILVFISFIFQQATAQKGKNKKHKLDEGRPRLLEVFGDSLRRDSVVYYETEIGFIMPDYSQKFKGRWNIQVMRRQTKASPDTLANSYFEFYNDSLFTAFVGCNKLNGYYFIKGPTIKFTITDTVLSPCTNEMEEWFIKLIQERVSYYGIDEKILYLKDVAYNTVFDCTRRKETEGGNSSYK